MTKEPAPQRSPRCPVCGRREAVLAVDPPPDGERLAELDPRALGARWWCRACGYVWRAGAHA